MIFLIFFRNSYGFRYYSSQLLKINFVLFLNISKKVVQRKSEGLNMNNPQ